MSRLLKLYKKVKNDIKINYLHYSKLKVDDHLVLLEAGHGNNLNGNMFAMLKEIKTNPKYKEYKCIFVVTKSNIEKAKVRMKNYNIDVILCIRNTNLYYKYLATSKYLFNDNSFPPCFIKRPEQVYLNTWHGTPLKTLGKSDKNGLSSFANIQKNYLMSDYALFPNEFTFNVFMDDYDLRAIFNNKYIIANYPRNYIFYNQQAGAVLKKKLGYNNKTVYAYMPTWRGVNKKREIKKSLKETIEFLTQLDKKLNKNTIVLINLHFLLSSEIDCSNFKHIKYFPSEYETYEILNACDCLITDYSSVFFDYAITGKKIILYTYDKEEYLNTRGTYLNIDSLPFSSANTFNELVSLLNKPYKVSKEFLDTYCVNGSINTCENIFDLMINGKSNIYDVKSNQDYKKNICLIYADKLQTAFEYPIEYYINNNDYYNIIVFRCALTDKKKEFLYSLDVPMLGLMNTFQFNFKELFYAFFSFFNKKVSNKLDKFFERENNRLFYNIKPKKIVDMSYRSVFMSGIISKFKCLKENILHGNYYILNKNVNKRIKNCLLYEKSKGFKSISYCKRENENYFLNAKKDIAHSSFSKLTKIKCFFPIFFNTKNKLNYISFILLKTPVKINKKDIFGMILEQNIDVKIKSLKLFGKYIGFIHVKISLLNIKNVDKPSTIYLCYLYNDRIVKVPIPYNSLRKKYKYVHGKFLFKEDILYTIRQNSKNKLYFSYKYRTNADYLVNRFKLFLAFLVSKIYKNNKIILIYEKDSSKYEESGKVLYEKLIDLNYKNVYFIIDKNYKFLNDVNEKYKSKLIFKNTFKHYLYYFKCKTFIGTELIIHSYDVRTNNTLALRKAFSRDLNYVFLQHGVMYMISLDSEARTIFTPKHLKGKYRVVVSSIEEANHFINLGNYKEENMYITGLCKYDCNTHNKDADKIVIMLTWRPFEFNAKGEFKNTNYYKLLCKLYKNVPNELKDKTIILLHPLLVSEINKIPLEMRKRIVIDQKYDDILKDTDILITDYSSISYDAFYRGSKILFCFKEKDYCLESYGKNTKLMINEDNIFGDIFYHEKELSNLIYKNYKSYQRKQYINNYRKIVKYHDGKNTLRLIKYLKEDGIL